MNTCSAMKLVACTHYHALCRNRIESYTPQQCKLYGDQTMIKLASYYVDSSCTYLIISIWFCHTFVIHAHAQTRNMHCNSMEVSLLSYRSAC